MKHPLLESIGACRDGAQFAETHPTLEAAWLACDRPDWLLWFAGRRKVDRKTLVRIACEIARLALPYAKDPCVLACIDVTERWCDDKATLDEVRAARKAAYDAGDAAAGAAYAAAYAADAAAGAAYYDAAYAAGAARVKTRTQCCAIIRKHLPTLPGGAA